ncbi:hypothetical protein GOBAR_AA19010 [Gossypium barbadense]|uniref:Uncharacterized protein n=1 Tax=Gossypium barbadense TaxID=3634 RepID=A0A2P5XE84_GOSBA|nr:hypothetical protein GOBAR_AA19010 [Gossypium barbadense]
MNKGREEIPNSEKFLKELLSNKKKLDATSHVELNAVCSAILKNELPNKLKDPGSFTIPCLVGSLSVNNALADLGAILLDVVDPHIVTTTPNEEIPLTVLSIFPFDTVEVSHPKFSTFKHTRPGTRACLKSWPNRGKDMAVRYGRVEAGHDFPKTQGAINPYGRVTWPWVNLIGILERGNDNPRMC